MPIPTNRLSYKDAYDIFDQAMEDPKGIRLPFNTKGEAKIMQLRLHKARSIERTENLKAYPPGDPMYGQSQYDILQVRLRYGDDDTVFVYVEPKDKGIPEIESLSEIEAEDEDAPIQS